MGSRKTQDAPPTQETASAKKSRKLDVEALRKTAATLPEAHFMLLTSLIDNFVEATEKKKIASRKLRQGLAFLV